MTPAEALSHTLDDLQSDLSLDGSGRMIARDIIVQYFQPFITELEELRKNCAPKDNQPFPFPADDIW
jgi:hypothetical protein